MTSDDQPTPPILIAAFEGWNDAGESASSLVAHLQNVWRAEQIAQLDSEDYYDFQVNRPIAMTTADGEERVLQWPGTTIWHATTGTGRGVILASGIEPSMRWKSYCREILKVSAEEGAESSIVIGAFLADVPHTRPVPASVYSNTPGFASASHADKTQYEGPTGIVGVLHDMAGRAGFASASIWAAVPHYVAQPPVPKATLALANRLEDLLGEAIPLGDLPEDSVAWQHGAEELASEDPEIAQYVSQLEELRDTAELPEASGEAIAQEFERYLKRRGQGPASTL